MCEHVEVTSNFIICKPPRDEPDENRPRVQVSLSKWNDDEFFVK